MIKSLENVSANEIIECFNNAFADYSISMTMPDDYWINRWNAAGIAYDLSFGFFDNGKLVAFVLHGIRTVDDKLSFFNMGTGVVPSHRGQRIIKQIYDVCYHELLKAGCQQGLLEVIQTNTKAIKSYQSVGFELESELISFKAKPLEITHNFNFSEVRPESLERYSTLQHSRLAWEHSNETIAFDLDHFRFFELHNGEKTLGYIIAKKANSSVVQLGVDSDDWEKYGEPLLSSFCNEISEYKIINIDAKDYALINFLESRGFQVLLKQFGMRLSID